MNMIFSLVKNNKSMLFSLLVSDYFCCHHCFPDRRHFGLLNNWKNIRQINMGNNLYSKPLAKNKLFPLESPHFYRIQLPFSDGQLEHVLKKRLL